jgi:hypothetical protein
MSRPVTGHEEQVSTKSMSSLASGTARPPVDAWCVDSRTDRSALNQRGQP